MSATQTYMSDMLEKSPQRNIEQSLQKLKTMLDSSLSKERQPLIQHNSKANEADSVATLISKPNMTRRG